MENSENCGAKGECPVKSCLCKLICFALPVFIFLFAAGFVVHHVWLMPIYEQTASLWRPKADMAQYFPWMLGLYGVLAITISGLFCKIQKARKAFYADKPEAECAIGGKHCPIKHGICFGILIGILLGTMAASTYIWTPIPGDLAVKWFLAWVVQGACIGILLGLIGHCKEKGCKK
jgi:hypothetical protein